MNRESFFQGFVCHAIHELGLFLLHFRPLQLHRGDIRKRFRIEQGVASRPQIRQGFGARGQFLPIFQPTPLAPDDVHKRLSHGTQAAAQIVSELLRRERGDRPQNPVVGPAVVFVEQTDVVFRHGDLFNLVLLPILPDRSIPAARSGQVSAISAILIRARKRHPVPERILP